MSIRLSDNFEVWKISEKSYVYKRTLEDFSGFKGLYNYSKAFGDLKKGSYVEGLPYLIDI